MLTIYGLRVLENPACSVPNFILSQRCAAVLTPQVAAGTQRWLNEFFGVTEKALVMPHPISGEQLVHLSARGIAELKIRKEFHDHHH
ncbi:hypothetical protein [Massilia pseudoviolaceinigra]|uniref:hypothetical protein n=1 Tax=Massilia pseudoviolaceinigra TaxID=3057165 RepID=UPI002796C7DB|nr:hypothetical protein [Massilia sp. CCM 9206]MDQ1921289.1 hypothetical protein [Massilia sp. CCM 9206]